MRKYIIILFWLLLASVVITSCDAEPVKVSVTMEADYSQIIEAINSANQTLTDKMSLIETALSKGFADDKAAQELLRQAIASLSGTADEKLTAIEAAVKSQTASLETKLGLIEAAVTGGFADVAAQQKLLESALESLSGTAAEELSLIEAAVNSQTASLETKLGLIEAAITSGHAEASSQQELIRTSLESLQGTLEEKLPLIEAAVKSETVSLETKLGLIGQSVSQGLADSQASLLLVRQALDALDGTLENKLASLESAIKSETAGLESKLALIEAAVEKGFADAPKQQDLILKAIEALGGTLDTKLAAISSAIASRQTELDTKLGLIDAAVQKGFTDRLEAESLMLEALESLDGDASAKLVSITSAVCSQTSSLWAKLDLIETAFIQGLADEVTALEGIVRALESMHNGNLGGIVSKIEAMKTTLEGKVAQGLADIFAAIANLSDYREILIAINRTLYNMTDHSINGHEYIEMGPGRKWATMNVGATLPEEKGDYYAWGDVETYYTSLDPLVWKTGKSGGYIGENYKFVEHSGTHDDRIHADRITKYTLEDRSYSSWWYNWGDDVFRGDRATELGDPQYNYADDVARQDWGATWRIPTKADWEWLIENCTWESTTDYKGKVGLLITSYIPGYEFNQIFLPAAGIIASVYGSGCEYWSSTLKETSEAYRLTRVSNWELVWLSRWWGLPVRPVSD